MKVMVVGLHLYWPTGRRPGGWARGVREKGWGLTCVLLLGLVALNCRDTSSWPRHSWQRSALHGLRTALWQQKTLLSSNGPAGKDVRNPLPHLFISHFPPEGEAHCLKTSTCMKKRRWRSAYCEKDIYWPPTTRSPGRVFAECIYIARDFFNSHATSRSWLLNSVWGNGVSGTENNLPRFKEPVRGRSRIQTWLLSDLILKSRCLLKNNWVSKQYF